MKESNRDFELVFVSSDQDDEKFKEYYNEMPWLALPFGDARKGKLSSRFEVSGMRYSAWDFVRSFKPFCNES